VPSASKTQAVAKLNVSLAGIGFVRDKGDPQFTKSVLGLNSVTRQKGGARFATLRISDTDSQGCPNTHPLSYSPDTPRRRMPPA